MKLKARFFCLVEKIMSLFTDQIVCISDAERKSAIKNNICKESKLTLIPNGIAIDSVRKAIAKPSMELCISESAYVVGMIGRITAQKAPDIFIKTAKLIKEHIPNAVFIIVGDGDMHTEIEEYAKKNGLQLFITGWTDEPYTYLKLFDVAVLSSRWEGFGLAVVEYMAAEKNVVASRIDAIPTIINDGVDGLLAAVDSPEDFCDKILWLHEHPDDAARMRANALEKVCDKYDIKRVAKQHLEMFEKLINQ